MSIKSVGSDLLYYCCYIFICYFIVYSFYAVIFLCCFILLLLCYAVQLFYITNILSSWPTGYYKSAVVNGAFQMVQLVKNPPAKAGDSRDEVSVPGPGRSPGVGNATQPSILAWRIPRTEEPGGLQSMGSQRVKHKWRIEHPHRHTVVDEYNCRFLFFFFLATLWGMWDLTFLTRDQTHAPCNGSIES